MVDDNAYTNLMARVNLHYAAEAVRTLAADDPEAHATLVSELALRPDEIDRWERAAEAMHVPFDERRGIRRTPASSITRSGISTRPLPSTSP